MDVQNPTPVDETKPASKITASITPKAQPWYGEVKVPRDEWATISADHWELVKDSWIERISRSGTKKHKITMDRAVKKAGGPEKFFRDLICKLVAGAAPDKSIVQFTNVGLLEGPGSVTVGAVFYLEPEIIWLDTTPEGVAARKFAALREVAPLPTNDEVAARIAKAHDSGIAGILKQFDELVEAPAGHVIGVGDVAVVSGKVGDNKVKGDRADVGGAGMPQPFTDAFVGKSVGDRAECSVEGLLPISLVIDRVFTVTKATLDDELAKKARFLSVADLTERTLKSAKSRAQKELVGEYTKKLFEALRPLCQIQPIPAELAQSNAINMWSQHRARFAGEKHALDALGVTNKEHAIGELGRQFMNNYAINILMRAVGAENGVEDMGDRDHSAVVVKDFLAPIFPQFV